MLEDELSQERMDREHQKHRIDELESRLSTAMDELEHIKFVFLFDFYFDAKTEHNFMCFCNATDSSFKQCIRTSPCISLVHSRLASLTGCMHFVYQILHHLSGHKCRDRFSVLLE